MKRSDITDLQVCQATRDSKQSREFITDLLVARIGCPIKVAESALKRAIDRDLIDYGVSTRTGWLTEKGEQLIKSKPKQIVPGLAIEKIADGTYWLYVNSATKRGAINLEIIKGTIAREAFIEWADEFLQEEQENAEESNGKETDTGSETSQISEATK